MKFLSLKFKKDHSPSLGSIRPVLFDVNLFWTISICLSAFVILTTLFIGFKLFYAEYNESYKEESNKEDFGNLIDINGLKRAVLERNNFIIQPTPLPRDPSI